MLSRFSKTPQSTLRARRLRRDATEVEKKLWHHLRSAQLQGISFRRQHPVGRYVVDFCAPSLRLVIELDGGQHAESQTDEKRTACLRALGFYVLRFWNNDVAENLDGVLEIIATTIAKQKTTPP